MQKTQTTPGFVLLLVALSSLLLALIVAPFAAAFFAAAVLAGVLHPLQMRCTGWLGGRPGLAAGLLTMALTLVAVAPLALLCVLVAQQGTALYGVGVEIYRRDGIDGLIGQLPAVLQDLARRIVENWPNNPSDPAAAGDAAGAVPDVVQLTGRQFATATDLVTSVLDGLAGVLLDLGVLVLTLFFLLRQGKQLVDWVVEVLPLSGDDGGRLVTEFRDVTRAVFGATVVTAFVQTLIAAVGYWIAAISYPAIALLLTFVCALIPIVGAALVVAGAGGLLLAYGETGYGIFLIVWGIVPVGLSDNLLKPWLAQGRLRLPGAVVMFAMLGGMFVFGAFGIVAGPLIVAFFLAALRLLKQKGFVPGLQQT